MKEIELWSLLNFLMQEKNTLTRNSPRYLNNRYSIRNLDPIDPAGGPTAQRRNSRKLSSVRKLIKRYKFHALSQSAFPVSPLSTQCGERERVERESEAETFTCFQIQDI